MASTYNTYYFDDDEPNDRESRFAEYEELSNLYSKVIIKDSIKANASGIPIDYDWFRSRLLVDNSDTNTIVISSTGTGKTRRIILPQLVSVAKEGKSSVIVNDTKGEFYRYMSEFYRNHGYKIVVLNFRDPLCGDRYNALKFGAEQYKKGNVSEAVSSFKSIAQTISVSIQSEKDPFWHESAINYFIGLALLASALYESSEVTFYSVFKLHIGGKKAIGVGSNTLLRQYCEAGKVEECAYNKLSAVLDAPSETRSSIYAVFDAMMAPFVENPDLIDSMTNSTFSIEDIVEVPTIIYLITRDEDRVYDSYIACLIDQFYKRLISIAESNNGSLPRRVEFILDEMGNLGKISDMDRKISASRSRNIRWTICIQSLKQLEVVYGSKMSDVIIGNSNNLMYLYSPDLKLLELIAKRCGCTDDYVPQPLITINQLQHFKPGECLLFLGRNYPYISHLPDISEYPIDIKIKAVKNIAPRERQIITYQGFPSDSKGKSEKAGTAPEKVMSTITNESDYEEIIAKIDAEIARIDAEIAAEEEKKKVSNKPNDERNNDDNKQGGS